MCSLSRDDRKGPLLVLNLAGILRVLLDLEPFFENGNILLLCEVWERWRVYLGNISEITK